MTYNTTVAIAAIAGLEAIAMCTGHDGLYLMPVVAIIGGLAGYHVRPLGDNILKKLAK